MDELLDKKLDFGCRELHLRAGQSPWTRACRGTTTGCFLPYEAFNPLDLMQLLYAILTDEQIRRFEREGELSFSYSLARRAAFDVHVVRSEAVLEADFVVAQDQRDL